MMVEKCPVDRHRHPELAGSRQAYPKSRVMVVPAVMGMGRSVPEGNFLLMVPRRRWVGRVYLLQLRR